MKKTRRKSDKKRWLILASIIALAAIIVFAYLNQTTTGIKQSSNYFSIIDPAAVGRSSTGTNETVLMSVLGFNFTPIGGDAHNVVLFLKGMTPAIDYTFELIKNGTSTFSGEMQIPYAIPVRKYQDGYHVDIRIRCDEADGNMIIVIPEDDFFVTGGPPL
jgi:hypothetical protein